MLTARQFLTAFHGTSRVARLKPDGIRMFDGTPAGFWASFWAAALLAPFLVTTLLIEASNVDDATRATRFVLLQSIGYVISWVAYPLAMVYVADLLQRGRHYYRYMVAYNWFRLVEAAAIYPLMLLGSVDLVSIDALAFFSLMALSAMLLYDWFIAKTALEIDGASAAGVVMISFLLGLLIRGLADKLL